jgi:hypothetical protein
VRIQGRSADGGWETLADAAGSTLRLTAAGIAVKRNANTLALPIDQIRIEMTFAANTSRKLARIAAI